MRAIRRHVDTIIAQTEALERLGATGTVNVSFRTVTSGAMGTSRDHALTVPVDELRALIQKRIDDADVAIRKLGMVAPAPPGSDVLERIRAQPGVGPGDPQQVAQTARPADDPPLMNPAT
jgi:hypothetical protein